MAGNTIPGYCHCVLSQDKLGTVIHGSAFLFVPRFDENFLGCREIIGKAPFSSFDCP